jgi:uncharacterized protein (DUF362 family)
MNTPMQRRSFIKSAAALGAAAFAAPSILSQALAAPGSSSRPVVSSVQGSDYFNNTLKAVDLLGGMGRFVKPGSSVGLLANVGGWLKFHGTYTCTEVVLATAKMAADAGAKKIFFLLKIAPDMWARSPLSAEHQALVSSITEVSGDYITRDIPKGIAIKKADMIKELFECDVFIDIPIFKHHGGTILTGCLKNIMGACSGSTDRFFHSGSTKRGAKEDLGFLAQAIADANLPRKPDLCVVDATEFLINNGPAGPGEIRKERRVFAGTDPVLLDCFGAELHHRKPSDIRVITNAAAHGIGTMDMAGCELRTA